jgi:hypothetical protein
LPSLWNQSDEEIVQVSAEAIKGVRRDAKLKDSLASDSRFYIKNFVFRSYLGARRNGPIPYDEWIRGGGCFGSGLPNLWIDHPSILIRLLILPLIPL